ncbi:hypothetical protein PR048_000664 [Dryococelus australis]|uniref:Transmembrane protein n=1 Tax=Dryococelus australis TaxID=614101 RepID=A0ABQ9IF98_9NEOP|nr:hypothetical protein PR048_000664 [Dryococelus australis]
MPHRRGWCNVRYRAALTAPSPVQVAGGHPDLNQGPLDLQSNALPLSYAPSWQKHGKCQIYILSYRVPVVVTAAECAAGRLTVFGSTRTSSAIFGSTQGGLGSLRFGFELTVVRAVLIAVSAVLSAALVVVREVQIAVSAVLNAVLIVLLCVVCRVLIALHEEQVEHAEQVKRWSKWSRWSKGGERMRRKRRRRKQGKLELFENARRPAVLSRTIPTSKNPAATLLGIEHSLPRWEESSLTITPPNLQSDHSLPVRRWRTSHRSATTVDLDEMCRRVWGIRVPELELPPFCDVAVRHLGSQYPFAIPTGPLTLDP